MKEADLLKITVEVCSRTKTRTQISEGFIPIFLPHTHFPALPSPSLGPLMEGADGEQRGLEAVRFH